MDIETINEDAVNREDDGQHISYLPANFSEESVVFSMLAFKKMLGMSAPLMLSHLTNMLGGFVDNFLSLCNQQISLSDLLRDKQHYYLSLNELI